jgi:hypothetical protein
LSSLRLEMGKLLWAKCADGEAVMLSQQAKQKAVSATECCCVSVIGKFIHSWPRWRSGGLEECRVEGNVYVMVGVLSHEFALI